jgi:hypothetical protein
MGRHDKKTFWKTRTLKIPLNNSSNIYSLSFLILCHQIKSDPTKIFMSAIFAERWCCDCSRNNEFVYSRTFKFRKIQKYISVNDLFEK